VCGPAPTSLNICKTAKIPVPASAADHTQFLADAGSPSALLTGKPLGEAAAALAWARHSLTNGSDPDAWSTELPPTDEPSPSPPHPIRQRAMAQLRPVSIPNIVSDIAGPDPLRGIADFKRHYMPDGQPAAETSPHGHSDEHRSQLKENAEGLSRSLSEVFAYLTYGTSSLEEARKLFSIITNVSQIMFLICFISIIYIITLVCIQMDFKPPDVKHS
jgi:hypothetical protein